MSTTFTGTTTSVNPASGLQWPTLTGGLLGGIFPVEEEEERHAPPPPPLPPLTDGESWRAEFRRALGNEIVYWLSLDAPDFAAPGVPRIFGLAQALLREDWAWLGEQCVRLRGERAITSDPQTRNAWHVIEHLAYHYTLAVAD